MCPAYHPHMPPPHFMPTGMAGSERMHVHSENFFFMMIVHLGWERIPLDSSLGHCWRTENRLGGGKGYRGKIMGGEGGMRSRF